MVWGQKKPHRLQPDAALRVYVPVRVRGVGGRVWGVWAGVETGQHLQHTESTWRHPPTLFNWCVITHGDTELFRDSTLTCVLPTAYVCVCASAFEAWLPEIVFFPPSLFLACLPHPFFKTAVCCKLVSHSGCATDQRTRLPRSLSVSVWETTQERCAGSRRWATTMFTDFLRFLWVRFVQPARRTWSILHN